MSSHDGQPHRDDRFDACPGRFFTPQRIIVIAFALVEAALLGWALAVTVLRDGAA